MMLDFTDIPIIDNHCHPIDPKKAVLEPSSLAREFYHGIGDIPEDGVRARSPCQIKKLISKFLGTLEALTRVYSQE